MMIENNDEQHHFLIEKLITVNNLNSRFDHITNSSLHQYILRL